MTTLHDRTTVQINERTFRTEKYANKKYSSTFRHFYNYQRYQAYKNETEEDVTVVSLISSSGGYIN